MSIKYGSHTIKAVIYNEFTKNGSKIVPYIVGMIVDGPRGGSYMLDEFCAEQLIKRVIPEANEVRAEAVIRKLAIKGEILLLRVSKPDFYSDRDISSLAREFKCCKALKRLKGLKEINTWKV